MLRLRYFAWLRTRIGRAEEELDPPASIETVEAFLGWLGAQGPGYAAALADPRQVRVAVNHEHVGPTHRLCAGDEVALFPPVTGG